LLDASPHFTQSQTSRFVTRWLLLVIALVVLMVTVGGATRLTGSGLSITEWKPITGSIPPLNDAQWQIEFEKYRQISQYDLLNKGMSLGEFQFIYWWEWGHRQLGRLIGLVYLLGFFWVVIKRYVTLPQAFILFGIGLLLGLQGFVGWIMVASGLKEGMVAVAPVKLTLHLTFACLFFASLVAMKTWLAPAQLSDQLAMRRTDQVTAWVLLILVFIQIALGGLVAGSKAGLTFNTWPLMDGGFAPALSTLFVTMPLWENFISNPALIQLNHRLGAYVLLVLVLWHVWRLNRHGLMPRAAQRAMWLNMAVLVQAVIGIITLLLVVPLWAGLLHQSFALVVLAIAVVHCINTTKAT
jgi:cytochrome c oxidase assembly protein subunit 15